MQSYLHCILEEEEERGEGEEGVGARGKGESLDGNRYIER